MSRFAQLKPAPPVALFALARRCQSDPHPKKVDLGIGAYRDENGKPWVLPVVRKVHIDIAKDEGINFEYLSQSGLPEFTNSASKLLLDENNPAIKQKRIVSIQSISGTGAVTLGAMFLIRVMQYKTVYCSNPTWPNHIGIFQTAGCDDIRYYRYWDAKNLTLDFVGMMEDLKAAPENSIIILHACAHNPTGVDPTDEQWKLIADVCEEKKLFPFFDCAYQGFATGDVDSDAKSFRYFVSRGFETLCCQSFAKNFGLYNQRIGNLTIVVKEPAQTEAVESQIVLIARKVYSNPPAQGARIVSKILNNSDLCNEWKQSIKMMSSRLADVRKSLKAKLEELKTPGNWDHITNQIGMFSYTGLNKNQVKHLIEEFHIYLPDDGRISLAGLNAGNVQYVAEAINHVVLNVK